MRRLWNRGCALFLVALAACSEVAEEPQRVAVGGGSAVQSLAGLESGWASTGSMAQERLLHTATLLASGKVLVAGGYNRTSELYDPATGTWASTGNTLVSHRYHTVTRLEDGQVLVAGGGPTTGINAELYDPATGTWGPTGNLVTYRRNHAAALLPGGKVLIMGGTDSAGRVLASAEVYDSADGTWVTTSPMGTARSHHTATLLPGGKVLVAGGSNGTGASSAAEVYDPATGAWTPVGSMATARRFHTATPLANGKVLVVGGGSDRALSASAEVYDPATGTWAATGSMAMPRRYHSATLLSVGKVLVVGGYHETTGIHTSSELYDPATGTWSVTYRMSVERYQHTATLLSDGRVLVAGGFSNGDQASAELYPSAPTSPATLSLRVTDAEDSPLPTASITYQGVPLRVDAEGQRSFAGLGAGRFVARVEAPGYAPATVASDLPQGISTGLQVQLLPLGEPLAFLAEQGGTFDKGNVRVTIPPGAIVDSNGRPVSGTVQVTIVPLDPTTQLSLSPGPLEGTTAADSERVMLESFFMAEVSLSSRGSPVQLAPGATARLEFVLPSSIASGLQPGESIPAWWLDLEAGLWREEGAGTVQPSTLRPGQLAWVADVHHFSWWNSDKPWWDKSCVNVQVVDSSGQPVPNVRVYATGVSYAGISYPVYTGLDGRACTEIKRAGTARVLASVSGYTPDAEALVRGTLDWAVCGTGPCIPLTLSVSGPDHSGIRNGSFEFGANPGNSWHTVFAGSNDLQDWVVTQGSIDIVSSRFWQSADGDRSIDLNGTSGGEISQTVVTQRGRRYQLSFFLAGNDYCGPPIKQLRVEAAGQYRDFSFDTSGWSYSNMGWEPSSFVFTAVSSNTTISFRSLISTGNCGPTIDAVSLTGL